jgi:hypothetical protein
MKITAYKVLLVDGKKLVSSGIYGEHKQEYVAGVTKECPNMFVFRRFKDAKVYAMFVNHIWAVEVEEEDMTRAPFKLLQGSVVDDAFDEFWENPHLFARNNPELMQSTPKGSYLVNKLTVLREGVANDRTSL